MPLVPNEWTVFGADGKAAGAVVLPARFTLLDAGKDFVIGVSTPAGGSQSLVRMKISR